MSSAKSSRARQRVSIVRLAPWLTFANSHPHDLMWPCTLLSAAAIAARAGWQVDVIDTHVEPSSVERIAKRCGGADLVLIDSMTPSMALARACAAAIRETTPEARIWALGQHASEVPEDFVYEGSPIDGTLAGEPDASIGELLENGATRAVDGSVVWRCGALLQRGGKRSVRKLDDLPPADPGGLLLDAYRMRSVSVPTFRSLRWGFLLTSRGCPYRCTFCSATLRQSYGSGFRGHSPERVVEDLSRLHRDHGIEAFYMIDDVFSFDRERVVAICEQLIRKRLPIFWAIQTRGDLLDAELCRLLRRAGCVAIKMGIESGVPRILEIIRKGQSPDDVLDAARAARAAGLSMTAYYMLGHPTETRREMELTFEFAERVDADMIQVAFHTPYPGSASYQAFRQRVRDASELSHYETQHVNPSEVDAGTLERLQRRFYLRYYLSPRRLARYVRRRGIYRAADPEEWRLVAKTLRYLLLPRARIGPSALAPRPTA